jgi:hypothetical protein
METTSVVRLFAQIAALAIIALLEAPLRAAGASEGPEHILDANQSFGNVAALTTGVRAPSRSPVIANVSRLNMNLETLSRRRLLINVSDLSHQARKQGRLASSGVGWSLRDTRPSGALHRSLGVNRVSSKHIQALTLNMLGHDVVLTELTLRRHITRVGFTVRF